MVYKINQYWRSKYQIETILPLKASNAILLKTLTLLLRVPASILRGLRTAVGTSLGPAANHCFGEAK